MTVTEQLHSLGSWSLSLVDDTPRAISDALGFFGHIAVWRGRVDVDQVDDATLLASARYVGVLREKPSGTRSLEGCGMIYWLGDEDGKGRVLESPVTFTSASLTTCVTTLLPPSVTVGTIHDPGGTYTGTHQWQTPRAVLDVICTAFGVEYRVNCNGTIDVGTVAQLYGATTSTIISARGAGNDFDLTSLGATFTTDTAVIDYSSRVVVLGQKTDSAGTSTPFVEGTADAATFPYKDLHGNTVHITRTVSDSGQTDASATAAAQLQLNLYNRAKRALTIRAEDYDVSSQAVVGQSAYVFDPENGLFDPATQIDFRGELIFPQVIRISALQWSITAGHTVAFRTQDGVWLDLTRWMVWDPGSDEITVGDLPRTLTSSSNPVLDQTQSAPDASTPNAPTGLALTTTSYESSKGQSTATITASWTAPALNTDGSVITDLSYYLVRYRWHGQAPLWDTRVTADTSIDIAALPVGLLYDVQVAAVDTTGHTSAFTAVVSITSAPDTQAPNPPSDPVVTSYLGQLRISWDGKDNTGAAMPPDFAVVEAHVSATSGFTPVAPPGSSTLMSQLSTGGVAYATAPYGSARYVKLVAVDNSGNRSSPSGQATGSTVQVADGDIAALSVGKLTAGTMSADVVVGGRFATALTGGRVEMNSLGFQKFDTDGVTKLVSITGAEALLTGTVKTALSGTRIEIGAAGNSGTISFYNSAGTQGIISASTGLGTGDIGMRVPVSGVSPGWNQIGVLGAETAVMNSGHLQFVFNGQMSGGTFDIYETNNANRGTSTTGLGFANPRFRVSSSQLLYWDHRATIDGGSGVLRLQIDSTGTTFAYPDGNGGLQLTSDSNLSFFPRGPYFSGGTADPGGFIRFTSPTNTVSTAFIEIGTQVQPNGSQYGGLIFWSFDGAPGYGTPKFEFKDATGASYVPLWANSFVVSSDGAGKSNIRDLDDDPVALIGGMRPRKYDKKMGANHPDNKNVIGFVAQEMPKQFVRKALNVSTGAEELGIDQMELLAVTVASLQAALGRLDRLERRAA